VDPKGFWRGIAALLLEKMLKDQRKRQSRSKLETD
jgi:hypothetical protein